MKEIERNLRRIRERIEIAAEKAGRNPAGIKLVAATKQVPPELINEAISAGIEIIGENRVQEALRKYSMINGPVQRHMIGHLQTNKANKALDIFELIQSVDSYRLAEELSKKASRKGKVIDVLLEVNTSEEPTKFGVKPGELISFVQKISALEGIRVRGLMTIGIFSTDAELVRPCFARLRRLREEIEEKGVEQIELLSMGMTHDFEVAIEEGSNMVRIGTGIFGARRR